MSDENTKNIFDFEEKISFILNNNNDLIIQDMANQNEYLNSDSINSNFKYIEESLDSLYEKIRVLEEAIDYAKVYINKEISSIFTECKNTLNEIEKMNDLNFLEVKNYRIINIPLVNNKVTQYMDRDGKVLKTCDIYNGIISLYGTIKNSVPIDNYSILSYQQVYERNNPNFNNGEYYRTHYIMDEVIENGVNEQFIINFKNPVNVNSIKVKLSNCQISKIVFIHEDNTELHSFGISTTMPIKKIKSARVTINSKTYETKKMLIQYNASNYFELVEAGKRLINSMIKDRDEKDLIEEYKSSLNEEIEILKGD